MNPEQQELSTRYSQNGDYQLIIQSGTSVEIFVA